LVRGESTTGELRKRGGGPGQDGFEDGVTQGEVIGEGELDGESLKGFWSDPDGSTDVVELARKK